MNRYLLDQMSLNGRGEVEYVGLQDDGSAAAKRFHERVRTPLLTDIQLTFQGVSVSEVYPNGFRPVQCEAGGGYRTLSGCGTRTVKITGKMGGHPFERVVPVELAATAQREGIRSLWARTKVAELTAEGATTHKEAITKLGLQYALMTPFTSFVAVEQQTISEAGKLRTIEVPVEAPEGVDARMAGADMAARASLHAPSASMWTGSRELKSKSAAGPGGMDVEFHEASTPPESRSWPPIAWEDWLGGVGRRAALCARCLTGDAEQTNRGRIANHRAAGRGEACDR